MEHSAMEEFENLDVTELRKLLTERLEETYGHHYLLGWLKTAYVNGYFMFDTDRDMLIKLIIDNTKVD